MGDTERESFIFKRRHGLKQKFSDKEPLNKYLLSDSHMYYYGLTVSNNCDLAYKFPTVNKKTIPRSWGFRKRHAELKLLSQKQLASVGSPVSTNYRHKFTIVMKLGLLQFICHQRYIRF